MDPQSPKNRTLKYLDHYALKLTMKNIPMVGNETVTKQKHTIWNTKKVNGWEKYKEATENNINLFRAAEMNIDDPEIIMKVITKELTSIKFKCFGKIKISNKNHDKRVLENLQRKKTELCRGPNNMHSPELTRLDNEMLLLMKKIQKRQFEKDVQHLEELKSKKGKSTANFFLKDTSQN